MENLLNNKVRETHRDISIIWDNVSAFSLHHKIICSHGTTNNKDHFLFGKFLFTISSPKHLNNLKVAEIIERYSE